MSIEDKITRDSTLKSYFLEMGFTFELLALTDPSTVQTMLKEKGLDLSLDEVKAFPQSLKKAMMNEKSTSSSNKTTIAPMVIIVEACIIAALLIYNALCHVYGW